MRSVHRHAVARACGVASDAVPVSQRHVVQAGSFPAGLHYAPSVVQRATAGAGQALPGNLRAGIEALSGLDMSGVRVHYGSPLPARLNAHAYAQGTDIHLARGQEKHLPHEAWHVVQQRMGRVQATSSMAGVGVNDDASLEREADRMGTRAVQMKDASPLAPTTRSYMNSSGKAVAQLTVNKQAAGRWYSDHDPYTTFPTKALATIYDRKLRLLGFKRRHFRVPTLYTYTHTKPHNKLSRALQGPHSVAHRVSLTALQGATTVADVQNIFNSQVLEPDDVDEVIDDEAPAKGYSGQMRPRIARYLTKYRKTHTSLSVELKKKTPDLIRSKHRLNKLLNLDPYATYGWKSLNKASHKHTKGKGENVTNPTFAQLTDHPPGGSIINTDALQSFLNARQELFDDHFP